MFVIQLRKRKKKKKEERKKEEAKAVSEIIPGLLCGV